MKITKKGLFGYTSYNVTIGIIKLLNQLYVDKKINIDKEILEIVKIKIKLYPPLIDIIKFFNKNEKKQLIIELIKNNPKIISDYKCFDKYLNYKERVKLITELLNNGQINEYMIIDIKDIDRMIKDIYIILILTGNIYYLIPKYIDKLNLNIETLKNIYYKDNTQKIDNISISYKSDNLIIAQQYHGLYFIIAEIDRNDKIKHIYGKIRGYKSIEQSFSISKNYLFYIKNILDK